MIKCNLPINLLLIIFLLFSTGTAAAEYYQYADEKGNLCFTDNKAEIPEKCLKQIQTFKSVQSPRHEKSNPPEPRSSDYITPDIRTWDGKLFAEAKKLQDEQMKLDILYHHYRKEQLLLEKKQKTPPIPLDKSLEARVEELNENIRHYHQRCGQLEIKINQFKQRIKRIKNG